MAIDSDTVVVAKTWRRARAESLDILPLVVNLARPTPAIGWRNRECPSFLDRARGGFDAVMMLAVVHHMVVTERVPLPEIVDLAAGADNRSIDHRIRRPRRLYVQAADTRPGCLAWGPR